MRKAANLRGRLFVERTEATDARESDAAAEAASASIAASLAALVDAAAAAAMDTGAAYAPDAKSAFAASSSLSRRATSLTSVATSPSRVTPGGKAQDPEPVPNGPPPRLRRAFALARSASTARRDASSTRYTSARVSAWALASSSARSRLCVRAWAASLAASAALGAPTTYPRALSIAPPAVPLPPSKNSSVSTSILLASARASASLSASAACSTRSLATLAAATSFAAPTIFSRAFGSGCATTNGGTVAKPDVKPPFPFVEEEEDEKDEDTPSPGPVEETPASSGPAALSASSSIAYSSARASASRLAAAYAASFSSISRAAAALAASAASLAVSARALEAAAAASAQHVPPPAAPQPDLPPGPPGRKPSSTRDRRSSVSILNPSASSDAARAACTADRTRSSDATDAASTAARATCAEKPTPGSSSHARIGFDVSYSSVGPSDRTPPLAAPHRVASARSACTSTPSASARRSATRALAATSFVSFDDGPAPAASPAQLRVVSSALRVESSCDSSDAAESRSSRLRFRSTTFSPASIPDATPYRA